MNFRLPTKCFMQIVLYCIIMQFFTASLSAKEKNDCSNQIAVQDSLNLNFHDTELIKILEYVETKTGYLFFYKEKDINLLKKITINIRCKDVFETMRILSGKAGVKYKIIKKNIVLYNSHKVGNGTKLESMDMLDKNKSNFKQDRITSPFPTISSVTKQELTETTDKSGLKQPDISAEKVKLSVKVISEKDKTPIENASVVVNPYNLWAISDNKGICTIDNIPSGEVEININLLGYETEKRKILLNSGLKEQIEISLKETSLALNEVNVVARSSKAGEATGSYIARQALDHLQATSLKDVLQLIPGQLINPNPSLNKIGQFSIRTIDEDNNNAFGSSIMVDGIPVSNNANMNLNGKGGSYSVAGKGVDLRSLGTDNIESIEVIRGIASAEYGDMSSGTLIINSKIGTTTLEVRGKIMPGINQIYAGKGFHAGNFGNINISADYADGNSDPRYTTDTYKRVNSSIIHSKNLFDGIWSITTKIGLNYIKDWSGSDPDDPIQGQYSQSKDLSLTFSHSGRISLNKLFARTLKYDLGYTNQTSDSYTIKSINLTAGPQPLYNAKGNTTQQTFLLPSQYLSSGGTKGKPVTFYAKISDNFFLGCEKFKNNIKIGLEFRNEGNKGTGYYFDNPERPLSITNNRTRSFKDIPFLSQVSGFIEDNIILKIGKTDLRMQAGLRYTTIQPGKDDTKNILTPRINFVYSPVKILDLRLGYGVSAKTPALMYLYPEYVYQDILNINYYPPNRPEEQLLLYTTKVHDLTNKNIEFMKSKKYEAGFDLNLPNKMVFSVIGFKEIVDNGFGTENTDWEATMFNKWYNSDLILVPGSKPQFNVNKPSAVDTILFCSAKPGNTSYSISKGIEFDFDLGRIESTKTSFYLSGSYMETKKGTNNMYYQSPIGYPGANPPIMLIYPKDSDNETRKRFSTTFRIVQHIPAIKFIVSFTGQAAWYDYTKTGNIPDLPVGYLTKDRTNIGKTDIVYFTEDQLKNPSNTNFEGFNLEKQRYVSKTKNIAETWPTLWLFNIRLTKELNKYLGFSFYVNNCVFSQPWQKSSISDAVQQRNRDLYSYGFEMFFKL